MSRKKESDPLYPTTETGSRLWSNICTLLGIAQTARVNLGNARERMVSLIRRLEEGDKGILVLDSLHRETVDEQYKRLQRESVLPIAIDNGEEMIVTSYGGNRPLGQPFPEYVILLHRDANGHETLGTYELISSREAIQKVDMASTPDSNGHPKVRVNAPPYDELGDTEVRVDYDRMARMNR